MEQTHRWIDAQGIVGLLKSTQPDRGRKLLKSGSVPHCSNCVTGDKETLCAVSAIFHCPDLLSNEEIQRVTGSSGWRLDKKTDWQTARSNLESVLESKAAPGYERISGQFEFPQCATQLLFCQRANNPNDWHSGQVCFPGGRVDPGEDCLTAAIRETMEETSVKLTPEEGFVCLGQLGEEFFAYWKNKKKVTISVFVFVSFRAIFPSLKLNPGELSRGWLQPLWNFWSYQHSQLVEIEMPPFVSRMMLSGWVPMKLAPPSEGDYQLKLSGFNLPVANSTVLLWGMTFRFFSHCLEAFISDSLGQHMGSAAASKGLYLILIARNFKITGPQAETVEFFAKRMVTNAQLVTPHQKL